MNRGGEWAARADGPALGTAKLAMARGHPAGPGRQNSDSVRRPPKKSKNTVFLNGTPDEIAEKLVDVFKNEIQVLD